MIRGIDRLAGSLLTYLLQSGKRTFDHIGLLIIVPKIWTVVGVVEGGRLRPAERPRPYSHWWLDNSTPFLRVLLEDQLDARHLPT